MKESQITQEVIDLAKKIAKHWRMEIYEGCWVCYTCPGNLGELELIKNPALYRVHPDSGHLEIRTRTPNMWHTSDNWFPIPDIHDCLEKLRELGYKTFFIYESDALHLWYVTASYSLIHEMEKAPLMSKADSIQAPTLHEALLQALLSVLEGEK